MAISGPIALYNNLPIHAEYYQPRRYRIANIILGLTTIIETTLDHDYVVGQLIRNLIPKPYGCQQLSGLVFTVLSIPETNQIEINVDSRFFDPFLQLDLKQVPQVIPIGDINNGAINMGRTNNTTYIYGSFINISPGK